MSTYTQKIKNYFTYAEGECVQDMANRSYGLGVVISNHLKYTSDATIEVVTVNFPLVNKTKSYPFDNKQADTIIYRLKSTPYYAHLLNFRDWKEARSPKTGKMCPVIIGHISKVELTGDQLADLTPEEERQNRKEFKRKEVKLKHATKAGVDRTGMQYHYTLIHPDGSHEKVTELAYSSHMDKINKAFNNSRFGGSYDNYNGNHSDY